MLFPSTKPFDVQMVPVDPIHTLYLEQYGNPDGQPVIMLHGGPGAPWSPDMVRFFDPECYRVVVFDQRGSWRSQPQGCLENNTTSHLIGDTETIRKQLAINRWMVFGWSWGSALAVAYAEAHRNRCEALVVQGVALFRPGFEHWDFRDSRALFPGPFEALEALSPAEQRHDLFGFYRDAILGRDDSLALEASKRWYAYSEVLSNAISIGDGLAPEQETDIDVLVGARISMHYWSNGAFLPADALYQNAVHLAGLPGAIVHGEQDFNCPIRGARDLHEVWPDSGLYPIPRAGHSAFEVPTAKQLFHVLEGLKIQRQSSVSSV